MPPNKKPAVPSPEMQQLLQVLNNPEALKAQLKKLGHEIPDKQEPAPKKRERPQPPAFSDDDDEGTRATKLVNFMVQSMDYMEGSVGDKFTEVETKSKKETAEQQRKAEEEKVAKFIADHPEMTNKFYHEANKYYKQGYKVEDAYRLGKQDFLEAGGKLDAKPDDSEEDDDPPDGEDAPPKKRSSMDSGGSDDADDKTEKKKPATIKEAAERNLLRVAKKQDDLPEGGVEELIGET